MSNFKLTAIIGPDGSGKSKRRYGIEEIMNELEIPVISTSPIRNHISKKLREELNDPNSMNIVERFETYLIENLKMEPWIEEKLKTYNIIEDRSILDTIISHRALFRYYLMKQGWSKGQIDYGFDSGIQNITDLKRFSPKYDSTKSIVRIPDKIIYVRANLDELDERLTRRPDRHFFESREILKYYLHEYDRYIQNITKNLGIPESRVKIVDTSKIPKNEKEKTYTKLFDFIMKP